MPSATEHPKDSARVAAGLKAALSNPHVSEEARERAMGKLKEMGQDVGPSEEQHLTRHREHDPAEKHRRTRYHESGATEDPNRVLGGYKATLSNPYTSADAKAHAEEVLEAAGILERHPDHTDEEHDTRVLGGYKAALHNPRVSDEAKQHAREYLQEHGVGVE